MKTVIYYFSGTGNNLAIAKQLAKELGNTTVLPIKTLLENKTVPVEYDWIGYLSPSYYSHVPPFVEECMQDVIYTKEQKVFLIAGCAGNRGLAIQDMRHKVNESKKEVSLEYMVMLAGSYILSYGAFPKWYCNFVRKMSYRKIHKIANAIRQNKSMMPLKAGFLYRQKYEERLQQAISKYSVIGKRYMTDEHCIGCGTCAKICPVNNIAMEQSKPVFSDHCNQCMACIQWCPQHAIDCDQKAKKRKCYHHADVRVDDMMIR